MLALSAALKTPSSSQNVALMRAELVCLSVSHVRDASWTRGCAQETADEPVSKFLVSPLHHPLQKLRKHLGRETA